jgi:hypothetical protein
MVLLGPSTLDGIGHKLEEAYKQTGNTTRKLLTLMFRCCVASGRSIRNFQRIYLLNRGEEITTVTRCDETPFNTETSIEREPRYTCV